ncbi:MAG: hypothetical protein IJP08_00095 [Bacteroidaceae bacterium]|nr:hypothetical protein [Bacteroidaceae bacterium]
MFYNNAKKEALKLLKSTESNYQELGEQANDCALRLYEVRKLAVEAINRVELYVNMLANTPKEFTKDIADVKISIKEFAHAIDIEKQNTSDNLKGTGAAVGGIAAGSAIAALGPTAAMAVATTFGTASTGTAIASLSGAAATKAALAWLGGGALAAGGGGMSAGSAFLALAGPVGWTVAGVAIVGGGFFASYKNKRAAEEATKITCEIEKHISKLRPKLQKLHRLLNETEKLKSGLNISLMVNTYPKDYLAFSDEQKMALATVINNVQAMGKLINTRVS